MRSALLAILCIAALALLALILWRLRDHLADRVEIARLLAFQPTDPPAFSHSLVANLPAPARRYFEFTILEGTPLYTVAEIDMEGTFGLGDLNNPNYMEMKAVEILAAPTGFLWKMSAGAGIRRISGTDSAKWTRFWLAGVAPVARAGGTRDHSRSAFARNASEAVFWSPAAVLPGPGVTWEPLDANSARVTIAHNGNSQAIDVTVDAEGRPTKIVLQRWSNANAERIYQLQPFGGFLSEFREFEGFRLPTHVEAGNFIDTNDYFPFFIADVASVKFTRLTTRQ